ncbi:MAG: hypothetical protein HEP71_13490 [Roseivirga sp.]|nr:hypothetical protein [Roseivirga sp.]
MVQLAEHSNGNGARVDMYHTFQGGVVVDFLSFPTFSGTVNFNDILSSIKICRSTANWVEFYIYEHAGFAGSREVWTINTQSEAIASDLNNYVRNRGLLGIGRTDWNDVVSSAKFIIH